MLVLWNPAVSGKALARRSASEVKMETRQDLCSTSKIFVFVKCRYSAAARVLTGNDQKPCSKSAEKNELLLRYQRFSVVEHVLNIDFYHLDLVWIIKLN